MSVAPTRTAGALERWGQAAVRLGLSSAAHAAGALLLAAELDEEVRARIIGAEGATIAPRRSDILRALAVDLGDEEATRGLAHLEQRGAAGPLSSYAGPWLSAELELDRRVRAHCLGGAPPAAGGRAGAAPHPIARVELAIQAALARVARRTEPLAVFVRGRPGSGRDAALRRLLAGLPSPALEKSVIELRQLTDPLEPELSGSIPIWDARRSDPSPDDYNLARRWLARSATVAIALLDRHQDAPDVEDRIALTLDVDPVSTAERCSGWEAALASVPAPGATRQAAALELCRRNRGGAGLAFRATHLLGDQGFEAAAPLVTAVEDQLAALVRPSTLRGILVERPQVELDRVIAAPEVVLLLQQVVMLARLASAVEAPGRVGIKALLSGPSGTGKTMAARAVASSLKLPLYRVDLAGVVSKWVGETEKNLREAMNAAEAAGAVLLFDEGDALFGKRGEVSRGSDRYANSEVAYLLQAIEAYDGVAIVTTNQRGNVDKAFERRFDACIEFPVPSPTERAAIWRQELGASGRSLQDGVLADLGKRAELTGGAIAAAARIARVLAIHAGHEQVTELDLRRSVRSELLKSGSTVQAARWGGDG
jgi:ATPase family associated with various cellular activities (AAA)